MVGLVGEQVLRLCSLCKFVTGGDEIFNWTEF